MLELDFELPHAITARRGTVTVFAAPTGLGVGEAVEQLLEVSLLEEGVNAGPVSPLKTTVFPTVQEFENEQYDTLDIQGGVHCDEFFYLWKRQIVVFGLLVPGA